MPDWSFNYRRPVRRSGAQEYVLVSLISFGGSVIFTRLFLELTGYPQLGGGELHIAHVLWGGLILFAAALLPIVLANRWALSVSAVRSGLGVGLFIDELGKFITTENDYFYPPAAPIIYAFFLLTVLLYLRVRRPANRKTRDELYRVLENLTEVLEHDLEPNERVALDQQLELIESQKSQPNQVRLAQALREFIRAESLDLAPARLTPFQRVVNNVTAWQNRILTKARFRMLIVLMLAVVGVMAFYELFAVLNALPATQKAVEELLAVGVRTGQVRSSIGAAWFLIHLILQTLVGLFAIVSGGLFSIFQERKGLELAAAALVIALTGVDLLAFFVDQFSATIAALTHLAALLILNEYRKRYVPGVLN